MDPMGCRWVSLAVSSVALLSDIVAMVYWSKDLRLDGRLAYATRSFLSNQREGAHGLELSKKMSNQG